jgi:hypothetical protein
MDAQKLTALARRFGIGEHHLAFGSKHVVHEIQRTQGREPCYLTDFRYYCKKACEWSGDCLSLRAEWLR